MVHFPGMEPIRQPKTARFVALRLYREELDQFVAMFKKECSTVTISDEKNRYDSLEEMRQHVEKPRLKFLDIRGENPGVHFLLNKTEELLGYPGAPPQKIVFNELRTEDTTDEADNLYFRLKDFLASHEAPKLGPLYTIAAFVVLMGGIFYIASTHAGAKEIVFRPVDDVVLLGTVASFLFLLMAGPRNYVSIETRRNSKTFFVKNREEFGKHSVTAGISSVIGALVGYLVGHFLK
jgi:hypothetical protein